MFGRAPHDRQNCLLLVISGCFSDKEVSVVLQQPDNLLPGQNPVEPELLLQRPLVRGVEETLGIHVVIVEVVRILRYSVGPEFEGLSISRENKNSVKVIYADCWSSNIHIEEKSLKYIFRS